MIRQLSVFHEYTRHEETAIFCVTTCETTVLVENFLTDRTHGNAKYCRFLVTSILVKKWRYFLLRLVKRLFYFSTLSQTGLVAKYRHFFVTSILVKKLRYFVLRLVKRLFYFSTLSQTGLVAKYRRFFVTSILVKKLRYFVLRLVKRLFYFLTLSQTGLMVTQNIAISS